jgi:single-stranded-DNA-specific exonuclease
MAETRWPGLNALKEVSDIRDDYITAEDLAFRLAPRLNAPGRIDSADVVARLLTTNEPTEAKDLALRINTTNSNRQDIERSIFDNIEGMIEAEGGISDRRTLFMGAGDWHRGVLGIVASKLVDKYYRPSLIFSTQDGLAVGSGRSIDGFNLFQVLGRCHHLFEKFGGHAHAAGFTIKTELLKTLENELESSARDILSNEDLIPAIHVDGEVLLDDINREMIGEVRSLSPFGQGNPEPCFLARSVEVLDSRVVGGHHLKLKVRQGRDGNVLDGIGFGMGNGYPLTGKQIHMVFTPEMNRWQGQESVQLRMIDFKIEGSKSLSV